MLLSPRMAGYRVYQCKKALDANREPVKGLIDPLLDELRPIVGSSKARADR